MNWTRFVSVVAATCVATTLSAAEGPSRWALLIGVDEYLWAQKLDYCGASSAEDRVALVPPAR